MKSLYTIICNLLIALLLISCSSDGGDDDVMTGPESFGSWSPAFTNQTSSFTQTRTGNQGTTQSRTINVTSSEVREETDEYDEAEDINGDGDQVDDITLITTTYTGSDNVGTHQVNSFEVDVDRDPTFFNANSGFWYNEIFFDVGDGVLQSGGYLAYDIYLGEIVVYSSDDGECIDEVEGESDGGDDDIVVNTQSEFLGAIYNLSLPDIDPNTTFDVYTGWERLTDSNGDPYLAYFVAYYDTAYSYNLPSAQEFIDGTQAAVDFVVNADLYITGNLALLDDSLIPEECTSGKYSANNFAAIPGYKKSLIHFLNLRSKH